MIGTASQEFLVECRHCCGSGKKAGAVGGICGYCTGTGRTAREFATFQRSLIGQAALAIWYWWMLFLALFRLSDNAVCVMSKGLPPGEDFHDYPDSTTGEPWHMFTHTCKRCGKEFTI